MLIYFKGFDAICDPMFNPTSKPQVWHGGGFARAAHWIDPPPPRSGGRACVDLVSNPVNSNFPTLRKGSRGSAARAQVATASPYRAGFNQFFDFSWPSEAIFGHLSPNMLPRSSQLDAKIAQESPTYGPKSGQNVIVLFDFTLRPFF